MGPEQAQVWQTVGGWGDVPVNILCHIFMFNVGSVHCWIKTPVEHLLMFSCIRVTPGLWSTCSHWLARRALLFCCLVSDWSSPSLCRPSGCQNPPKARGRQTPASGWLLPESPPTVSALSWAEKKKRSAFDPSSVLPTHRRQLPPTCVYLWVSILNPCARTPRWGEPGSLETSCCRQPGMQQVKRSINVINWQIKLMHKTSKAKNYIYLNICLKKIKTFSREMN